MKKFLQDICRLQRPRLACTSAQADLSRHYPLRESLDTVEYVSGRQKPWYDTAHTQGDLNLLILRMLNDIFLNVGV